MTVCKVALANLAMWARDHYFPPSYAQATWKRLLPFFQLPGTITQDATLVQVELRPFNDRVLNRDLALLCCVTASIRRLLASLMGVGSPSPSVPRVALLLRRGWAKYRDFLIQPYGSRVWSGPTHHVTPRGSRVCMYSANWFPVHAKRSISSCGLRRAVARTHESLAALRVSTKRSHVCRSLS